MKNSFVPKSPLTAHGRLAVEVNCCPHTTAVHNQTEKYCAVVDVCIAVLLDMQGARFSNVREVLALEKSKF